METTIAETTTSIVETATEAVEHLTSEQWEYVYSVVQKYDVYADYIMGFAIFALTCFLCKMVYKFFCMFFH